MKQILVSGSIANDYIMNFHDEFGKYILPEKTNQLSVWFNIDEFHAHNGGAGQNISYNLWLLKQESILLGAVGKERLASEFNKQWIDYTYTVISETHHTAVANIMTDNKNNQITSFYPWASFDAHLMSIDQVKQEISIAIVAPNAPETMMNHTIQCKKNGIPVIFDPGQPLPVFSKQMLHDTLTAATYLIVNEYELDLLCKIAELQESDLLQFVDAYIVTLGSNGSRYVDKNETFTVPAELISEVKDPTWAWDSFRAGILYCIHHGKTWKEGMELWSKLAAACIQVHGTQTHTL